MDRQATTASSNAAKDAKFEAPKALAEKLAKFGGTDVAGGDVIIAGI